MLIPGVAPIAKSAGKDSAWQTQAARYALLSEAVLLIAKTSELEPLLNAVMGKMKWVIEFQRCSLALVNENENTYAIRVLLETRRGATKDGKPAVPLSEGICGDTIGKRQVRVIENYVATRGELPPFKPMEKSSAASSSPPNSAVDSRPTT